MRYRPLGRSGLMVPVLSFGTGTFGGRGEFFGRWGHTDVVQARRLIDRCLDAGVTLFDTANIYSRGASEEILGEALKGRRDQALVATKATFTMGSGPNDRGSSRWHLIRACEESLRRLQTDHVDLLFMHGFDALPAVDEVARALDDLVSAGKVRYLGCSNFSGWHVMKSLAASDRHGWNRYVSYQGYYSLIGRDYEHELMPLALDQGLGTMVWSPLGWGRLTGRIRRGSAPREGRIAEGGAVGGPEVDDEYLYRVVDALEEVAGELGATIPQVALAWVISRPSVSTVVMGARDEAQLDENLRAAELELSDAQVEKLDAASHRTPPYPYWHQRDFSDRNPKPTRW